MRWSANVVLGVALLALRGCVGGRCADLSVASPITIVIGYTPGAVSDLAARTIGEGLHQAWGQPVIVDNRPGSGGNIGAGYVARATPDGYTLMVGTDAQMSSNVYLYKHVGYDPVKDFAPVAYAGANIICLAVNAQLPINSVADVIAYAKAQSRQARATERRASARRIISPASCCARRPASTSSTCPIAAAARP